MGQRLIALAHADSELELAAALETAQHPAIGQDAGMLAGCGEVGVLLAADLPDKVDVVVDFSIPDAAAEITAQCGQRQVPLVLATTGFDEQQESQILATSEVIAIVWAPNMSPAVNLAMQLSKRTAEALKGHPSGVDVEIIERHHRFKEDAPSGTALRFGKLIADAMGQTAATHGREGRPGMRPRNEIGYHAVRTGDNPGEHTIIFGMLGETLEVAVRASSRDCYAHGALLAARFVVGRPPGIYNMEQVLGL